MYKFNFPGKIEFMIDTDTREEAFDIADKIIKEKDFKGGAIDYYDQT